MQNDFSNFNGQGAPDIKRLMLVCVLMTVVLVGYGYIFPPKPPAAASAKKEAPAAVQPAAQGAIVAAGPQGAAFASATKDSPQTFHKFQTDVRASLGVNTSNAVRGGYQATVSSWGGQISEYILNGYQIPVHLVYPNFTGAAFFDLVSRDSQLTLAENSPYDIVSTASDSLVLKRVTPQGVSISRQYRFAQDAFRIDQEIKLTNEGTQTVVPALDIVMAMKEPIGHESSLLTPGQDSFSAICDMEDKRHAVLVKEVDDGPKLFSGKAHYAAFDHRYFLNAMVVEDGKISGCSVTQVKEKDTDTKALVIRLNYEPLILAPGASASLRLTSYLGPKQLGLLQQAGHKLEDNVNFGWFGVIARPMLWLLVQINHFVGNFGLAIILLTLIIKLLTFPLTQKSFVSMQQMKKLSPLLKEIQAKYAHDRTALGQKQMELYKEKGINPMAGCLPMLIQMPVWFALYQMLWNSVELYQQPFIFWIKDLTQADPFYVLPVTMGVSWLIQTVMQPTPEDQPQMKYMMWAMPVIFTFVMLSLPSGLSLYMLTNNLLTLAQQFYIKRRFAT